MLEDSDPRSSPRSSASTRRAASRAPTSTPAATRTLGNLASVAFGGPDLRTVYLGSLFGSRIATFRSPVAGAGRRTGATERSATTLRETAHAGPRKVTVTEVGPRDGWQIERRVHPDRDQDRADQRAGRRRRQGHRVLVVRLAARGAATRRCRRGAAGRRPLQGHQVRRAGAERQGRRARRRGRRRRDPRVRLGLREPQPQERQPVGRGIARTASRT